MSILLPDTIIGDYYRIVKPLGEKDNSVTYQAVDLKNKQNVLLKAFSFPSLKDEKILELLHKEGEVLIKLNHPKIPPYLNYFKGKTKEDTNNFYLVQQLIKGESLASKRKNGWQPKPEEIKIIAIQVLKILAFLQVFTPPIIHRDIKADNIIITTEGEILLVNFEIIQEINNKPKKEVNKDPKYYTYSSVEKEQQEGILTTDVYDLGKTLFFLITGKNPLSLPKSKLEINLHSEIKYSSNFAVWLEKMLEPITEKRFLSARKALDSLKENTKKASAKPKKPKDTPITVIKKENKLSIKIPPVWLRSKDSFLLSMLPLLIIILRFVILILIFICIFGILKNYTKTALSSEWENIQNFLFLLLGYCFFDLIINLLIRNFLFRGIFKTYLEITPSYWGIKQNIIFWKFKKLKRKTKDVVSIKINTFKLFWQKQPLTYLDFRILKDQENIGLFLSQSENEWLLAEIKYFLTNYK